MSVHSRHGGNHFPPLPGEPAEVCARLQGELVARPNAVILYVCGEVDAYTLPRWRRMLDAAFLAAAETGHLVVDIGDAGFLGCRAVLDLAARAQQAAAEGIGVDLVNPVPSVVDRIIAVAGLSAWLPVHTYLVDALVAHKRGPERAAAG